MKFPLFFKNIESIILQDKLSDFLGVFDNGFVEFFYIDVVKSAGHSCPTVLGAFLMTREGLKALYPDSTPIRGEIKVEFGENSNEGVAGVIANVITQITGATSRFGFKGLNGIFDRRDLMFFEENINSSVRFTRLDTDESVDVFYNPNAIAPNPKQAELMQKCIMQTASQEEKIEFGRLWQSRVEMISQNTNSVIKIIK
jgi:hypothetical protein